MKYFKLRVDLVEGVTPSKVLALVDEYSCEYIYCREISYQVEKPHMHFVLRTPRSESDFRDKVRMLSFASIGLMPKGSYSIGKVKESPPDYPIEAIAYCMKQGDWAPRHGEEDAFPDEVLDKAIAINEGVQAQIKADKEAKKKEIKTHGKFKTMLKYLAEKDPSTVQEAFHKLIDYYNKEQEPIRRSTLVTLVETYFCRISQTYRINYVENLTFTQPSQILKDKVKFQVQSNPLGESSSEDES